METQQKKKFHMSTFDKVVLIVLFVFGVLIGAANMLERGGYRLIRTEVPLAGALLLLLGLIVWGVSAIVRRFKSKTGKMLSVAIFGTIVLIIGSLAFTYLSQFAQLTLPSKYSVLTSESGKKAVVMMRIDTGMESEEAFQATNDRMNARRDAIIAEDPSVTITEEEPYPIGAYGYVYTVYPVKAGLFFDEKADLEGAVYRGAQSEAKLLFQWQEDGSLRLYLENAEIGDEGEALLKF